MGTAFEIKNPFAIYHLQRLGIILTTFGVNRMNPLGGVFKSSLYATVKKSTFVTDTLPGACWWRYTRDS
ncbi:MAG: hypothetical protein ACRCVL_07325, partial [Cetobacterium sp.]